MRTTVTLPDQLVADAMELTGIEDRAQLIRLAMERLVQREAMLRLVRMGGIAPGIDVPPRERPEPSPEWKQRYREMGIE